MTEQAITKSDFMELMMGVLTEKINAKKHYHKTNYPDTYMLCPAEKLTADEIAFIRTVADNIYTFAVADGMNRAFEAMRRDTVLQEEDNDPA